MGEISGPHDEPGPGSQPDHPADSHLDGQSDCGDDLAIVFANIARHLQTGHNPAEVLRHITTSAVAVIPGCQHAGITSVDHTGKLATPVASSTVPEAVDAIQYETGEGPCLDAIRRHQIFYTGQLDTETRWPQFSQRAARQTGVISMLAFRLHLDEDTLDSLNLYSHAAHAFDTHGRTIGTVLAAHAAVALSSSRETQRADNLDHALDTSREIGIAIGIGILMARYHHTRDAAFDALRHASQQTNTKLRDLATQVTDTGDLPTSLK